MRQCPSCGHPLPPEAVRFCVACGKTLQDHTQPIATQPTATQPTATQLVRDAGRQGQQPPARSGPRPQPGWLIAITALLVLAAGGSAAFIMLHGHRGRNVSARAGISPHATTAAPTSAAATGASDEHAQLARITPLISQSAAARAMVVKATQQVGACTMAPADGIGLMNQAVSERQAILGSLGSITVDAIPDGEQMLADLKQATAQSIAADQGFIGWMQDMQSAAACPVDTSQDSSYNAGLQASSQAMQAKQDFVTFWNPLASKLGEPTFTATQF